MGFEATSWVYLVLPFEKQKAGFFLETPYQLRLICYLVGNFLAAFSLKLTSSHSNLRLRGKIELFIKKHV